MRRVIVLSAFTLISFPPAPTQAAENEAWTDPYWSLLHEPAAVAELKLSPKQHKSFLAMRDGLDLRFFPLRNKSREAAVAGAEKLIAEARAKLEDLLDPKQRQRFSQLVLQRLGMDALLQKEVADRLRYSDAQEARVAEIRNETKSAVAELQNELKEGKDRQELQKKYNDLLVSQQKKLFQVLNNYQRAALSDILGKPFDASQLGQPRFRAPDFVDTGEWINSSPLTLERLRGKVVVVHFYAFGCINCIHNYPWYREWRERFKKDDVVIVGIHTPETNAEQNSDAVRRKAAEEKFDFPVLIDRKKENWNAWGNSMWPSVYLIDKQGYFRNHWAGELKWQGNDGEKFMRERIEALLAERAP